MVYLEHVLERVEDIMEEVGSDLKKATSSKRGVSSQSKAASAIDPLQLATPSIKKRLEYMQSVHPKKSRAKSCQNLKKIKMSVNL